MTSGEWLRRGARDSYLSCLGWILVELYRNQRAFYCLGGLSRSEFPGLKAEEHGSGHKTFVIYLYDGVGKGFSSFGVDCGRLDDICGETERYKPCTYGVVS